MTIIDHRVDQVQTERELRTAMNARARRAARRRAEQLADDALAQGIVDCGVPTWGDVLSLEEINESNGFIVTRNKFYC